jgi:thiamine-monophosphate kinase
MSPEFDLIHRFFVRGQRPGAHVKLGVGDDCALLAPTPGYELAVSTDTLVEGVHFFPGTDPESLGHKALAVNLSDLAAMGAIPRAALLAVTLPSVDESWLTAFAKGFFTLADAHHIDLVGGDTTRGPLSMTLTVMGEVEPGCSLRRDRAEVGDDVWVSGELGAAALAVRRRSGKESADQGWHPGNDARLDRPQPRIALGRSLIGKAHAAIDVSDGLLADLGHICELSKVAARLEWTAIPRSRALENQAPSICQACVLAGGDDYELVFTAPVNARRSIEALQTIVPVSRIGIIVAGVPRVEVLDVDGSHIDFAGAGFDHFADS